VASLNALSRANARLSFSMDPVTLARSRACCVARPLRSSEKPKPSRRLDRDGERVITKVVAGTRNTRFLRLVEQAIPQLAA
jgi:hypothetical protein